MSNVSYYTAEGLQNLKDELHQMKTVERPKISQQIAEARDKGDLSENAEYDAAKEAQGLLEAKINKMENLLANARVIDDSDIDNSKVFILSKVRIKNQKNGAEVTYTLVAENEANLAEKKISVDSPIGKGLLGKAVGDVAEVTVPAGVIPLRSWRSHADGVHLQQDCGWGHSLPSGGGERRVFGLSGHHAPGTRPCSCHTEARSGSHLGFGASAPRPIAPVFPKVALAIEQAVPCQRVGQAVIGLEVPHAHIHLIPLQSVADINFERPKLQVSQEDLAAMAEKLRASFASI